METLEAININVVRLKISLLRSLINAMELFDDKYQSNIITDSFKNAHQTFRCDADPRSRKHRAHLVCSQPLPSKTLVIDWMRHVHLDYSRNLASQQTSSFLTQMLAKTLATKSSTKKLAHPQVGAHGRKPNSPIDSIEQLLVCYTLRSTK